MSFGNFRETNESSEVNEARESNDNTEKPRNQILETPDSYDDDFDSKLDNNEKNKERESDGEHEQGKTSLFDKMKNLFSKKDSGETEESEGGEDETPEGNDSDRRSSFLEDLRRDAPSMEEQAKRAKDLPGRDEYLDSREKSERARQEYPDMKDWELSPEQLSEVRRGQQEVAGGRKLDNESIGDGRPESNTGV